MSDTITFTRAQWNEIFDGLDLIRDRYDSLFEVAAALSTLGLDKPAGTITAVEDDIVETVRRLHRVLMDGDDTNAATKKVKLVRRRFWPLNNSNSKEA